MSELPWQNQYQFNFMSYYKWPHWSHHIKNGFVVSSDKHRKCSAIIKLSSSLVLLDICLVFIFINYETAAHIHLERDVTVARDAKTVTQFYPFNSEPCSVQPVFFLLSDFNSNVKFMEKSKQLVRWGQFCMRISDSHWDSTKCSYSYLAPNSFFFNSLHGNAHLNIPHMMDCYAAPAKNVWMWMTWLPQMSWMCRI